MVVLVNAGSGMGFGETAPLRNGITARALGLEYDGEGSPLAAEGAVHRAGAPADHLSCSAWSGHGVTATRSAPSRAPFGLFSLWFPLLTTLAAAWVIFGLVPKLFGLPMGTIRLYQPDLGLVLIASAVTGVCGRCSGSASPNSGHPRRP